MQACGAIYIRFWSALVNLEGAPVGSLRMQACDAVYIRFWSALVNLEGTPEEGFAHASLWCRILD
jgi:hypothetical protein